MFDAGLFMTENLTTLHSSSDRLIDEMASGLGDLKQLRPPLGPSSAGFHSCSGGHGISCSIHRSRLEYHENEGESVVAPTDQIENPHEKNAREKRKPSSSRNDE
ncbi:hypothetical protein CK203_099935 [Vitis vinifera]|uniref:Uncharacterized protein n=1 Tax=Vitis vinifera TaxID=29760 RepID=A0A438CYP1_VITVI|nr:hypothetical protein CK203_099935 [Vitis vinifera]